jgi:hypothetical protein
VRNQIVGVKDQELFGSFTESFSTHRSNLPKGLFAATQSQRKTVMMIL